MQQHRWLILTVLPRYSKVSWGACSLISCLHVLSISSRNKSPRKPPPLPDPKPNPTLTLQGGHFSGVFFPDTLSILIKNFREALHK